MVWYEIEQGNYGKVENTWWEGLEWSRSQIRSSKVVAPACVDQGPRWLGPNEQALIMYWRIRDLWGPTNLVVVHIS
jgi:hypothetical protein